MSERKKEQTKDRKMNKLGPLKDFDREDTILPNLTTHEHIIHPFRFSKILTTQQDPILQILFPVYVTQRLFLFISLLFIVTPRLPSH